MTLIQITNSDGSSHSCDERCYNAKGIVCNCPCGGINHGVGLERAIANTKDKSETILSEWKKESPEAEQMWLSSYIK